MSPCDKIRAADKATDQMLVLIAEALDHLQRAFTGRVLNGWGVFADLSATRSNLFMAYTALHKAAVIMGSTPWPTQRDYDEAQ